MTTDDITFEEVGVIRALINDERGWLRLDEIAEALRLKNQEAKHYVEKLGKKSYVVEFEHPDFSEEVEAYQLTAEGRTLWVEKLRDLPPPPVI